MTAALPSPSFDALATQWAVQPIMLAVVLLGGASYAWAVRRLARQGTSWPLGRTIIFGLGLLALLWSTNGFAQAYTTSLYWVWSSQLLALLLVLPLMLFTGHPLQLARAVGSRRVDRFLQSGLARTLSNPLVGPALVPLLSAVLFFGPLPGWSIRWAPVGWLLQLIVLVIGGLIVLPLIGLDDEPSSLAVGLSLAIGSFELVLDAIPGIVLRLQTHLSTSYFDYRRPQPWALSHIHDQQFAGAVLWCAAEVIDLPFLLLVFRRWIRADARDAAQVDAVLEAERVARAAIGRTSGSGGFPARDGTDPAESATEGPADTPWWLSDPAMQRRMRGPR